MAVALLTNPILASQLIHGLLFAVFLSSIIYLYTHTQHNNNNNNNSTENVVEAAVLDTYAVFNYGDFRRQKSYKAGELQCAICREELTDDDVVRVLPHCSHVFKRECIDEWLLRYSVECPVCRADLSRPPTAGAGRSVGGERVDPPTAAEVARRLLAKPQRTKSLSVAGVDGADGRRRFDSRELVEVSPFRRALSC